MTLVRREALLLVKANGRLVDCTAWRTWTRSTWKVDMVPADVERRGRGRGGAAANGRLADGFPVSRSRPDQLVGHKAQADCIFALEFLL